MIWRKMIHVHVSFCSLFLQSQAWRWKWLLYASTYILVLTFERGKPWPQVFCVPAMHKIPWRWKNVCVQSCTQKAYAHWWRNMRSMPKGTVLLIYILFKSYSKNMWQIICHLGGLILEFILFYFIIFCSWKRLSRWQEGFGFVWVVLLVTSVEEWTTQALGFIYLLIYFGLNCEELPLKIRQLVVEQLSGTLRPEVTCPGSSLPLLALPKA